jgi:hypothetical protein
LGAGRLVVDLRTARLPGGDTPLKLNLGLGEAVLLVPRNVCVATRSDIGIGASRLFDRVDGGWTSIASTLPLRRRAPPGW